ncbi:hypothetical protein F5148DRAFT_418991 [Russula earlei]|uniref:Uncharacterized protein n=1 Tax=Russula earlei TaxID=71964 RepID=A0ACC0U1Q8_9AGAM|nr:hypothetical protein F5148DRAFT_418991 [Russula earlei]
MNLLLALLAGQPTFLFVWVNPVWDTSLRLASKCSLVFKWRRRTLHSKALIPLSDPCIRINIWTAPTVLSPRRPCKLGSRCPLTCVVVVAIPSMDVAQVASFFLTPAACQHRDSHSSFLLLIASGFLTL